MYWRRKSAFNKFLSLGKSEDEGEGEVRKLNRESWRNFVTSLKTDLTRPKPVVYKLI